MRFVMIIVALCVGAKTGIGQELPRMRNFAPVAYNAQNQNWSLTQSSDGWLYAANNSGVLEFDGARWQTFFLPDKQTVRAVAAGPHGEIFCGGFAEFGYWKKNASSGQLVYQSLSRQVRSDNLEQEEIWHILVCDGFVLFQSFSTLYKYDYQRVTVLQPPASIMFAREVNKRLYIPVIGRGVYELLPDNTFRFVVGTEPLADKIIQFLISDGETGIWAGTTNHGIFTITEGKCKPWIHPLNSAFRQYQLNKAIRLKKGGWVFGTILNGAYIFDAGGALRFHLNRENGLQNNTVLALLEDRDQNLWLGLDRGIDLAALRSPLTFFSNQTGKIGTVYTAALYNGYLLLGTNQGVFQKKKAEPGTQFQLVEGTQGQVWQLQVFDNQLICGHNSGTYLLSGTAARKISEITGGWSTLRLPARDDVLVQGTYTGLVVFTKNATGQWQFSHRVSGFGKPLRKIAFDNQGYLWGVHPNKGLFRFRLSEDLTSVAEFRVITAADGLLSDYQLDLALVNGQLVVNAPRGAQRIVSSAGSNTLAFSPIESETSRNKWLPGLSPDYFVLDSSGLQMRSPSASLLLPLKLVPGFENIVALNPEEYLFCLEDGFALLNKQRLNTPDTLHPAVPVVRFIESTTGRVLEPASGVPMEWSAAERNLKFHFAIPAYERPPQFSWMLEGYSRRFSQWQNSPEKELINLPSGDHVLHLRADNGGPETVIKFHIVPPWYLTAWAWLVYGGAFVSLLLLLEQYNRARLARQLARQRAEAEREKLALEVDNKSRELSNAALNLIRKNEALQRIKDDLVEAKGEPRALQKLTRLIDSHLEGDHDWELFEESFNRVHDDFFKRIMHQFPDLTPGDLRLAAYLKMNLSSKEIAPLLNISVRGIENKRYRLRKKLGLPEEANLTEFIIAY